MKKIVSLCLILTLSLMSGISSFAAEKEENIPKIINLTEAGFDLDNHNRQSQTIILPDGTETTVSIEYVSPPKTRTDVGNYELSDGTWKIYWYTAVINCSYYIDIKNSKIVNAYDVWYLCVGPVATGASLTYSSSKSSLYMTFQTPIWDIISWTGYLNARIEGNRLITSAI